MKVVNVNFILVMVVVLFLFAVSGKGYLSLRSVDRTLNKLDSGIEQIISKDGEVSDVLALGLWFVLSGGIQIVLLLLAVFLTGIKVKKFTF